MTFSSPHKPTVIKQSVTSSSSSVVTFDGIAVWLEIMNDGPSTVYVTFPGQAAFAIDSGMAMPFPLDAIHVTTFTLSLVSGGSTSDVTVFAGVV